jgi:thiol-disulfide isomerase/thioredoxin
MKIRTPVLALAFMLACSPTHEPTVAAVEDTNGPRNELPEHLARTVDTWRQIVVRNMKAAAAESRIGGKREVRWTEIERAELELTRSEAREAITNASAEDQPWLLEAYIECFAFYGIGAEWADAILDIPPEHPVWSGPHAWGLFDALEESHEPAKLRAYIHAAAAIHDAPLVDAQSIFLHLEDADKARDWARARELHVRLESIQIPRGTSTVAANDLLDLSNQLDPARPLRADTQVTSYCGPAILGPHMGTRVCLDEQFPHEQPTLIIGWATWCGPCNAQLPEVIELVGDRPLRVIAISYDEDASLARTHLQELGIDNWTVLLPRAERPVPSDAIGLDWRPIPFLALVDEHGKVEAGPPWLDAETLAIALRP